MKKKSIIAILVGTVVIFTGIAVVRLTEKTQAEETRGECASCTGGCLQDNPATPNLNESLATPSGQSDYYLTNSGWSMDSATYDCAPNYKGWGNDRWHLTLTSPKNLTVKVTDCCCPGDFYEIYVNDELIGTTPQVPWWGCISYSGYWGNPAYLSSGSVNVNLNPGTYVIKIRDAGFDGHTPAKIESEQMCPAGYSVTGTLSPITIKPDFIISEVKPVQVVWDSKIDDNDTIDLVAGKSTMVRVEVGMKDYETLDKQQIVKVRLNFDGINYTESKTIEQLEQNNQIEFYPASPAILGNQIITAKVDPENKIKESNEDNNKNSTEVTVKDTQPLYISYFRVNSKWPANYGVPGPEDFSRTTDQSGAFILGSYPISENEFTNEKRSEEFIGNPIPWGERWPWFGIQSDLKNLAKLRAQLNAGDRAAGVVSDAYFAYHGLCCDDKCAKGVSLPFGVWDAVLIQEGYPTATAHEIGHTYGLRLSCPSPLVCPFLSEEDKKRFFPGEEYKFDKEKCEITYEGNSANGFWVEKKEPIENSICFMGTAPKEKYHFDRWICDECYEKLFQRFRVNSDDPENLLLISGTVFKDKPIELDNWYYLKNGMMEYPVEYPLPDDFSIQLLNWEGQIIEDISFPISFEMYVNPFGVIETETAPFVRVIPYPEDTLKIRIQYQDQSPIEFNPTIKLLHDAIDLIPDHGFINNPDQRRNALYNKIEAVEKMLENNNIRGAKNKLEQDIKDKIEKWLIEDYQKEEPLQLSKSEIEELMDKIIERLNLALEDKN